MSFENQSIEQRRRLAAHFFTSCLSACSSTAPFRMTLVSPGHFSRQLFLLRCLVMRSQCRCAQSHCHRHGPRGHCSAGSSGIVGTAGNTAEFKRPREVISSDYEFSLQSQATPEPPLSFTSVAGNSGGHRVPTIASVTGVGLRQQIVLPLNRGSPCSAAPRSPPDTIWYDPDVADTA